MQEKKTPKTIKKPAASRVRKTEKVLNPIVAKKPVEAKVAVVKESPAYHAVGRRKRSTSNVQLFSGKGESTINNIPLSKVARSSMDLDTILAPFIITGTSNDYYFNAKVNGGGINGQLGAVRHGISRALSLVSDNLKVTLASNGFLTRDPREKQRKKYFFVRARKRPQFSKR